MSEPAEPHRIKLVGDYGLDRRDELRRLLEDVKIGPVTLDLSGVTYADSIFLTQLVRLQQRLRDVTLRGADANLRKIFTVSGFDQLFHIVDE